MTEQTSKVEQSSYYLEEIDLQKYWLVLKRRWLPAVATLGAVIGLSILTALSEESVYRAHGKLQFRNDRSSSLTGLEDDFGRVEVLGFQSEPLATQSEIVRSTPVIEAVITTLNLRNDEGRLRSPRNILRRLEVNPIPGTEILQITYRGDDPQEAAAIVNQVMQAYRDQNIASNRQEAAAARQFIEEQLPQTEADVADAEAALRSFKEQNNIIALDQEASSAVETLSLLEREMTQLQAQLADSDARLTELQQQLSITSGEAIALSSLNQSEGVQSVLTELQTVQAELAAEQSRYRTGHPAIVEIERRQTQLESLLNERIQSVLASQEVSPGRLSTGDLQLGALRQELAAELTRLAVDRVGLSNRMNQLVQSREGYRQRANALPGLEKTQRELERRLQAYQTTYETLLTQLQEIRVIENQTIGNVRIVSQAEAPLAPIASNRKLFVFAGGIVGLCLAIAVAFLLDLLDSSVKTMREARELFGYTLLGVIPQIEETSSTVVSDAFHPRLLMHQSAHLTVREAYQMLQANLKFLQSDKEFKTLVVTSAAVGEGKSEVCANLAVVLAQVGKRVLVLDADMRYPRQHHAMQVLNNVGLSHVIAGQAELETAIQPVMDNLDVLTAGVVPPNPIALLDSQRMDSLLGTLAQSYDTVLVDVPPVVGYADASIVSKMADGILFVARPGFVTYDQGRTAKEIFERSNQNVLGIIVNGVNARNESISYLLSKGRSSRMLGGERAASLLPSSRSQD